MTALVDAPERCSFCREPAAGLVVDDRGGSLACAAHGWELIREREGAHWFAHLRLVEEADR